MNWAREQKEIRAERRAPATYQAQRWAEGKTDAEIREEITRCEVAVLQPYVWSRVENAHHTMNYAEALADILKQRNPAPPVVPCVCECPEGEHCDCPCDDCRPEPS